MIGRIILPVKNKVIRESKQNIKYIYYFIYNIITHLAAMEHRGNISRWLTSHGFTSEGSEALVLTSDFLINACSQALVNGKMSSSARMHCCHPFGDFTFKQRKKDATTGIKASKLNIIFSSPSYLLREHFYDLCIMIKLYVEPARRKLNNCDTCYICFQLLH